MFRDLQAQARECTGAKDPHADIMFYKMDSDI